ncbi:MAG: hypothetical protein R3F60_14505 [bacterium]
MRPALIAAALIAAALGLTGCGSLLRAELGPTWIEDRGTGGTVQLTAGLPIVAGSGVADVLVIGGAATVVQGEVFAGLVFGCDVFVTPGGIDPPPGVDHRDGVGGALRFHPRADADGVAIGGGLGLFHGAGERREGGSINLARGEKYSFDIDWDRRAWLNVGGAVDVVYRMADKTRPGRLRVDALALIERLVVTE